MFVHWAAGHLAVTPLRFAPSSGRTEDIHRQAVVHTRLTKKKAVLRGI